MARPTKRSSGFRRSGRARKNAPSINDSAMKLWTWKIGIEIYRRNSPHHGIRHSSAPCPPKNRARHEHSSKSPAGSAKRNPRCVMNMEIGMLFHAIEPCKSSAAGQPSAVGKPTGEPVTASATECGRNKTSATNPPLHKKPATVNARPHRHSATPVIAQQMIPTRTRPR